MAQGTVQKKSSEITDFGFLEELAKVMNFCNAI